MIKLFELHEQVSAALGDVVYCSNTSIPDGARYNKNLRDKYIYRATLEMYRRCISPLSGSPRKVTVPYLQGLFPNQTSRLTVKCTPAVDMSGDISVVPPPFEYSALLPRMIYVYHGELEVKAHLVKGRKAESSVPINIYDSYRMNALKNARHTHIPNLSMTIESTNQIATQVRVYDYANEFQDARHKDGQDPWIVIYGLQIPNDPAQAVPGDPSNGNLPYSYGSYIEVEDYMLDMIVNLCSMYGLTDSQDLQSPEQILIANLNTITQRQ